MPIIFTDRRKGLTLISKEYEGSSYLMHYRTKGSKNGVRRWQHEDGSYTSEGYQHYAEMYGWGKNKRTEKKMAKIDERTSKIESMREHSVDVLESANDIRSSKRAIKLVDTIDRMYDKNEAAKNKLGFTGSEMKFGNDALRMAKDKKLRDAIQNVFKEGFKNGEFEEIKKSALEYSDQAVQFDVAYRECSNRWEKEHPNKEFDGDGTEFHWELEKRYPEYKKEYDKLEVAIAKVVRDVIAESKKEKFQNIKGADKYLNFYDKMGTKDSPWYKVGNAKAFAIAMALLGSDGESDHFFPEMFIEQFDSHGKDLGNPYLHNLTPG